MSLILPVRSSLGGSPVLAAGEAAGNGMTMYNFFWGISMIILCAPGSEITVIGCGLVISMRIN